MDTLFASMGLVECFECEILTTEFCAYCSLCNDCCGRVIACDDCEMLACIDCIEIQSIQCMCDPKCKKILCEYCCHYPADEPLSLDCIYNKLRQNATPQDLVNVHICNIHQTHNATCPICFANLCKKNSVIWMYVLEIRDVEIKHSLCNHELLQKFHKKNFKYVMEELELLPGNRLALEAEADFNFHMKIRESEMNKNRRSEM